MDDNGSILVPGAAGQLGAVGRTVTGLLLDRGLPVRAMVRREDDVNGPSGYDTRRNRFRFQPDRRSRVQPTGVARLRNRFPGRHGSSPYL